MNRRRHRWPADLAICIVAVTTSGCAHDGSSLRRRLEAYDPADRVRAITEAARSGDPEIASALVDRLDDEDTAVRFYAILALEKLTDTRLGYSYASPAAERRASIEAWRDYLRRRTLPQNNARVASSGTLETKDAGGEDIDVDVDGSAADDSERAQSPGDQPAGIP